MIKGPGLPWNSSFTVTEVYQLTTCRNTHKFVIMGALPTHVIVCMCPSTHHTIKLRARLILLLEKLCRQCSWTRTKKQPATLLNKYKERLPKALKDSLVNNNRSGIRHSAWYSADEMGHSRNRGVNSVRLRDSDRFQQLVLWALA